MRKCNLHKFRKYSMNQIALSLIIVAPFILYSKSFFFFGEPKCPDCLMNRNIKKNLEIQP